MKMRARLQAAVKRSTPTASNIGWSASGGSSKSLAELADRFAEIVWSEHLELPWNSRGVRYKRGQLVRPESQHARCRVHSLQDAVAGRKRLGNDLAVGMDEHASLDLPRDDPRSLRDECDRVRRIVEAVPVPGQRGSDDAVDTERPPRVAITVPGDEIPPSPGVDDVKRLDRPLAFLAGVIAIAEPDALGPPTAGGERDEYFGVDRWQIAPRQLDRAAGNRRDLLAEPDR